jgi:hypothetical protein
VRIEGDHIQCYYDGGKYLDVKDSTFQVSGKIGLWTKADAQSHFDDFDNERRISGLISSVVLGLLYRRLR